MKKPSSGIESIIEVINGIITEEEFFSKKSDGVGRLIVDLPELLILRKQPVLFREFLLSVSLAGRFKILLTKEILGMPQKSLYTKYGIPNDALRFLKGLQTVTNTSPMPEIRKINLVSSPRIEILATIALFSRLPITWLLEEKPENKWTTEYFYYLPDAHLNLDQFINLLKKTEEQALQYSQTKLHSRPDFQYVYDVRGVILHFNESEKLYLRLLFWEQGGFVIEIFNKQKQLQGFWQLKSLLKHFGPIEVGYCQTVINSQINIMFIVKSSSINFSYPTEFQRFNF